VFPLAALLCSCAIQFPLTKMEKRVVQPNGLDPPVQRESNSPASWTSSADSAGPETECTSPQPRPTKAIAAEANRRQRVKIISKPMGPIGS
jgi:hypothetical protein